MVTGTTTSYYLLSVKDYGLEHDSQSHQGDPPGAKSNGSPAKMGPAKETPFWANLPSKWLLFDIYKVT